MNSSDETLRDRVDSLDRAVFGDRENIRDKPGIISELAQMNLTLIDVRDAMRRINWTIILAVLTAILVTVIKNIPNFPQ